MLSWLKIPDTPSGHLTEAMVRCGTGILIIGISPAIWDKPLFAFTAMFTAFAHDLVPVPGTLSDFIEGGIVSREQYQALFSVLLKLVFSSLMVVEGCRQTVKGLLYAASAWSIYRRSGWK
jgi:hypothetical protein